MSDSCKPIIKFKDIQVINYLNKKKFVFTKKSDVDKSYKKINEYLYDDDTILNVSNKISSYCTDYKTTGNFIYMWYLNDKKKESILFKYDKETGIPTLDIDYEFVYRSGVVKYKNIENNSNLLLENYDIDKIYFIHLYDFYKLHGISINKEYTKDNWLPELPDIELYINGIIKKYWPYATNILKKNDSKNNDIENILSNTSKLISVINDVEIDDKTCDGFYYSFVKLNIFNNNDNQVNIIKFFAEIILDESIPFIKLVLDDYNNSYYKIHKPSIISVNSLINKNLINRWIKDFNKNNILGFNRYIFNNNVIVLKKFLNINKINFYYSIIIHFTGKIDIVIDNHNSINITDKELNDIFIDYNKLIKKYKSFFVELPLLDLDVLKNNNKKTKVEYINCIIKYRMSNFVSKSKKVQFLKENILTFFKNMNPYTRIIDEKYLYVNDKDSIYLRYKRVNNYNNIDTISSIISSLSNPRLNLSRNDIINKLVDIFSISYLQADDEYSKWLSIKKQNILDNKKIHTIIADEPGVEMNIFNRNNVDMLFELNDINSFPELTRISKLIYSFTRLYQKYLLKTDKKNEMYFKSIVKENKSKKISFNINNVQDDDIILGLDDILERTINTSEKKINITDDDIIGIDDLLSYISTSDDSNNSFDFNLLSGGSSKSEGSSPRSEYDISRYYINRLTDSSRDPKLFKFDPLIVSPSGSKYTYTRICDGTSKRQPIVVNDDELENINNSTNIGSGPNSYSNVITTGVDKNLHYICPKYWDISRNISLDPNNPNWTEEQKRSEIIPYTQKSGKTKKTVLDRTSKWWGDDRDVSEFYVDFLEDKRYRSDNVLMPCCFGKRIQKKSTDTDYISSVTPSPINSYSQPFDSFKEFFNQTNNFLSLDKKSGVAKNKVSLITKEKLKEYKTNSLNDSKKKYDEMCKNLKLDIDLLIYLNRPKNTDNVPFGFVKLGIEQDNISFIRSVSKCLGITVNKILDDIINISIEKFQCMGKIINYFKKEFSELSNDDIESFCTWINESNDSLRKNIKIPVYKSISDLIIFLNKSENGSYINYLFNLYISWKNYILYIKSDDFKDDHYVLPILEILYDHNIIVLEHIYNDIKLKLPLNNFIPLNNKYIIILKKSNFYEPLFYRTFWPEKKYEDNIKKNIDISIFKLDYNVFNTSNPTPEIKSNVLLQTSLATIKNMIDINTCEIYDKINILKENNIIIKSFVVDSYNQVSHLVDDNKLLLPINPQPIINRNDYELIYSLDKFNLYNINESIDFINKCNDFLSITTVINGIIVDKNNKITNVIINNNYIPVKKTINKTKYIVMGNMDLRDVDKKIIYNEIKDDSYIFNDFYNFENNLNQLFNNNIITYLKTSEIIEKHLEVLNIDNFTIGETYDLSVVNINLNSKMYTIYTKTEYNGIVGKVYKKIKLNSPDSKLYPNWGKIYVRYNYLQELKSILNDPIKLDHYKKKQLYPIIKSICDKIIKVEKMDPSIYVHNKLCFLDDMDCTYPCKKTISSCKLIIHDKSIDGSDLLNKFIFKLIDIMLINKTNLDNIFSYKIEPYELKKTTKRDEFFFTYDDFKNDLINEIFKLNNSFMRNINIY
uniref:Uncharacterized protein n=1 Tax=viral metagenome TaxID=1070528 RepID=A0A6C0CXJ6_9ZZZZ